MIIFLVHFDANSSEFTQLERIGHLYLGPQCTPPSHLLVLPRVSQAPLPLPNLAEFPIPNNYYVHKLGWDVLPPSPQANTTSWGKLEHNQPMPSAASSTSFGPHEKIPLPDEDPPKYT